MTETKSSKELSPGQIRVAERAQAHPEEKMQSLCHHLDEAALKRAFNRLRAKAAVGVDGVTKEKYGENLDETIFDLQTRMKAMKYRHQPIKRVYIPKEKGGRRPIGISSTEDKIVQGALAELLSLLYEPVFLPCSFGFRPGRSPHDALKVFNREVRAGTANFVYEIDITAFFDNMDRAMLREMMSRRIDDRNLMRLVGKCLHVGILDGVEFEEPENGATQGSSLSPLLGNIYLHYALDEWFEKEVRPRLRGRRTYIRFADDVLMGFELQEDAGKVQQVIGKRLARFNLELSQDKTRLVDFRKPPGGQQGGKGPGTFDFLGFTHFRGRSRKGFWQPRWKAATGKRRRFANKISEYCRKNRHKPLKEQHAALVSRIRGHLNCFAVNGTYRVIEAQLQTFKHTWLKWLRRRSQKNKLTWKRFSEVLKTYPMPELKVYKDLWKTS